MIFFQMKGGRGRYVRLVVLSELRGNLLDGLVLRFRNLGYIL
jgi:hypothetical protein